MKNVVFIVFVIIVGCIPYSKQEIQEAWNTYQNDQSSFVLLPTQNITGCNSLKITDYQSGDMELVSNQMFSNKGQDIWQAEGCQRLFECFRETSYNIYTDSFIRSSNINCRILLDYSNNDQNTFLEETKIEDDFIDNL